MPESRAVRVIKESYCKILPRSAEPIVFGTLILLNVVSYISYSSDGSTMLPSASIASKSTMVPPQAHANDTSPSVGSWIGDLWIPQEQRMYSGEEFQSFFSGTNMLFIGDSLARRTFATLYYILNATDLQYLGANSINRPQNIDVNRASFPYRERCGKAHMSLCRSLKNHRNASLPPSIADHAFKPCAGSILQVLKSINVQEYDLIVLIFGGHHIQDACGEHGDDQIPLLLDYLESLESSNLTIVWRLFTQVEPKHKTWNYTQEWNQAALRRIEEHQQRHWDETKTLSSLTALDWTSVIMPRAFAPDRILGDTVVHFGLAARLVFCEMLLHHLKQYQARKQLLHDQGNQRQEILLVDRNNKKREQSHPKNASDGQTGFL